MATNASSSSKIDLFFQNLIQAMKMSQIWIFVKLKYIFEKGSFYLLSFWAKKPSENEEKIKIQFTRLFLLIFTLWLSKTEKFVYLWACVWNDARLNVNKILSFFFKSKQNNKSKAKQKWHFRENDLEKWQISR